LLNSKFRPSPGRSYLALIRRHQPDGAFDILVLNVLALFADAENEPTNYLLGPGDVVVVRNQIVTSLTHIECGTTLRKPLVGACLQACSSFIKLIASYIRSRQE